MQTRTPSTTGDSTPTNRPPRSICRHKRRRHLGVEEPLNARVNNYGQIYPVPAGLLKQPTDSGSTCLGSHSTTFGKKIVKQMVKRNTT